MKGDGEYDGKTAVTHLMSPAHKKHMKNNLAKSMKEDKKTKKE
jgi:hypothetical protein